MPNTHTTLSSLFSDIADAIRSKTGSQSQIVADNFPTEIANISTGVDTSDATAVAEDIVAPKTAYIATGKTTGALVDRGTVNVTLDKTTTSYTISKGKYENGSVSIVPQTKTVTPSTVQQTVTPDNGKVLTSVIINAANVSLSRTTLATKTRSTSGGYSDTCSISSSSDFSVSAYTTYGLLIEVESSNATSPYFSVSLTERVNGSNKAVSYDSNVKIASSADTIKNFILYSTTSVPESLTFSVTYGGSQFATVTATLTLYQFNSSEIMSALQL